MRWINPHWLHSSLVAFPHVVSTHIMSWFVWRYTRLHETLHMIVGRYKKLHTLWIQTPEKVRKVRKTSLTRNQAPPRRVCRGDKPLHLNVEASRDDLVYRAEARKHITEDWSLSQLKSLDHVFDGFYVCFFSEHEMYNLYNRYFHKNWSFNVQDANGF